MQDESNTGNRAMISPQRRRRSSPYVDPHYYDRDRILARQRNRARTHITRDGFGRPIGQPISDSPSPISEIS